LITVRPLDKADIEAVFALDQATPEAPHWPLSDYEALLKPESYAALQRVGLAALTEDALAGFAVARLLLDGAENVCELESIIVRADGRRQGIGITLLKTVMAWAVGLGGRRLALEVRAGNSAAIQLYERAGLRQEGVRRGYYSATGEDAVLMGMNMT